jgi:hypothetical protein
MDHGDDQRTEELNSLRLALATFALQLDAFEARLKGSASRDQYRSFWSGYYSGAT